MFGYRNSTCIRPGRDRDTAEHRVSEWTSSRTCSVLVRKGDRELHVTRERVRSGCEGPAVARDDKCSWEKDRVPEIEATLSP